MSSMRPPSQTALQRRKLGVSSTRSGDAAHNGQVETFLRERLENWDREAAEVIVVWSHVCGMCSPEYQSQLRNAQATLRKTNKKEKRCETTELQALNDSQKSCPRRHRDRPAADFWTRRQVQLDAAQRHRDRQLQRQQRPEANGQMNPPCSSTHEPNPPACSKQVRIFGAGSTSVSSRLTPVGVHHVPLTPAPPTTPPRSCRRANGGGVTQSGAQCVLTLELESSKNERSGKRTELASPLNKRGDCTLYGTCSNGSGSAIPSTVDEHEVSAAGSTPTATPSQPSSSISGTFIVRRRPGVHGHLYSSSKVVLKHTTQASRAISGSPLPVAPSPPQPTHRTSRHSSANTSNAAQEGRTDAEVNAPSSLLPMDSSLPFPSRAATAIFDSRSNSCENVSASHRRRRTRERSLDGPTHRERSRGEVNTDTQESAANASSQIFAPIENGLHPDNLSSVSSAASYLNRGDREQC
ncbi:hypothetical protein CUR178_00694 [Leishmania enriettii]|uniref:Uncharacterized protein n=1 Tax=Leishmania enriettii TaxID=5663 RepID=A0A836K7G0_LEIEN|nr:hypothetical protein CUR178_00694 [Leishmania enriettii]